MEDEDQVLKLVGQEIRFYHTEIVNLLLILFTEQLRRLHFRGGCYKINF